MDDKRLEAYVNLINQLLTCSGGEQVQILESNRELVDVELLQVMAQEAQKLAANGHQNSAVVLLRIGNELLESLGISESRTSTNLLLLEYVPFLKEVLQATADSKSDPKVVYPLLEANLDKLDDNFAHILQLMTTAILSEGKPQIAQRIAVVIWDFSTLIEQFPLGNKANNMEIAITGYKQVLNVFTHESNPETWANIQNDLGAAYSNRIRHDKADNLELAIEAYQLVLSVYTKQNFPYYWAGTQNNLGNAYCDRIRYDKADNLKLAIEAYQLALSVYTKQDFPYEWATTQNNLGSAYCDRIRHDKADNLELAIKAFKLALKVRTKQDFPYEWATTQNNLGNAYSYIRGDRAYNLELAIEAYQLALEVRTKSDFPYEWATTQTNLGLAYRDRICGDKQENLKYAIAAYQLALEVYTPEADPIHCLNTSRNLGNLHFTQANWQASINAYEQAITAVELSRSWASTDQGRQEIMSMAIDAYQKLVQAYINIEQWDRAIETVERSKTRNLVELLANRYLYPKGDVPQGIITELDRLRRNIPSLERRLQIVIQQLLISKDEKQQQQRKLLEESQKQLEQELQQSRQQLDQLLKEINDNYDSRFSLTQKVETIPFREIQSLIDERTALIEWYITGDKILTFIVTSHNQYPVIAQSSAEDCDALFNWVYQYLRPYYQKKRPVQR